MIVMEEYAFEFNEQKKDLSNLDQPIQPQAGWLCGIGCENGMVCGGGCGSGVGGACGFGCHKG